MNGADQHTDGEEGTWLRAIRNAADAPDPEESLTAFLSTIGPAAGAIAGAVVDHQPPRIRTTWNCAPAEVIPEPASVESGLNPETRSAETTAAPLFPEGFTYRIDGLACDFSRIPLREQAGEETTLVLFFPAGLTLSAPQRERIAAVGALARMLFERHALTEEVRRARYARDHFLVAIHHELRTPATAIMLEAGLLTSGVVGELPPRLQKSVGRLETQVVELTRVVRHVLDLARLEAAAEPLRDELIDPKQAIIELARRIEPAAERKGIKLALFFPRTLPRLQSDGQRFRRIVLYLLANALKYTDRGRIEIRVERTVRLVGASRREPLLVVRVSDTGLGIPAEDLERIFEPFAQVEEGARTDSQVRGVGLGLPLARKLARSLGGDVTVESEPGKGTTATVLHPYLQAPG